MENNKLCNWILYYSKRDSKVVNSETDIDIESNLLIKQRFCSSICYLDCGKVIFDDFPDTSTGFVGLFQYLANDKGNVMEKMKEDEQRLYISKLRDCDHFSMRHHVSIIKCLMKSYVCRLAPWDRITRALEAIGISGDTEKVTNTATYRHLQKYLFLWLKEAASRGLVRLLKSSKNVTESQISTIINNSCLGSLLLYAMIYYAQTKMIKYTIKLPVIESASSNNNNNNGTSKPDWCRDHCGIVMAAFADICDSTDVLPVEIESLLSSSLDSVPVTLTIALTFHWTFGNSLRNLENLLKSTISFSSSGNCDISPSHRPSHLSLQNNNSSPQSHESKPFFINNSNNTPSNDDGLRQLFSTGKKNIVNGASKTNVDGNVTPEIFLTPTEDEMPTSFINPVTPPIKLLSFKTVENVPKSTANTINSEPISFSLKAEFQKKQKDKPATVKSQPRVNVIPSNETTWMAQSSKNEVVPLTPKKVSKSASTVSQNDLSGSLTKGKLNEIQIQLSIRRKKIESEKQNIAKEKEKSLETNKQKAFFQVIDKGANIVRRKSFELTKNAKGMDDIDSDRPTSMYITKTELDRRPRISKEPLEAFVESPIPSVLNHVEPNEALRVSTDTVITSNDAPVFLSRKNSSASISSLSSSGSDRNHVTKDEYQKSIDLLSTSLTSLQEEIRMLSKQQLSWNSKLTHPLDKIDLKSENNSVPETPTNNGASSLTEITELSKPLSKMTSTPTSTIECQPVASMSPEMLESVNQISQFINPVIANCPSPDRADRHNGRDSVMQASDNTCQRSHTSSPDGIDRDHELGNNSRESSMDRNNDQLTVSFTSSLTDDERGHMTSSSSESIKVATNAQPISFIIAEDQVNAEANRKKAELLAIREQRRLFKLGLLRQKREQERENRISATNEELLERELKKRLEQEKRDSLLKKYLDRKNEESVPSPSRRALSTSGTPVKLTNHPTTPRPTLSKKKPESVENLTLSSPQRNGWFSSIRRNHRMTSSSTTTLDTNAAPNDDYKFGVPLPPQEYMGPKLFGKRKVKTNRSVIANAISHCCLAGSVNEPVKESVLKELTDAEGTHFMILFRDARCQYRSLYVFDLNNEDLNLITGSGPKKITHEMVEKFFKYNSGAKQFNAILSTKHLSPAVDAICIQSLYWHALKPTGPQLSAAVSSNSISQTKNKRHT